MLNNKEPLVYAAMGTLHRFLEPLFQWLEICYPKDCLEEYYDYDEQEWYQEPTRYYGILKNKVYSIYRAYISDAIDNFLREIFGEDAQ